MICRTVIHDVETGSWVREVLTVNNRFASRCLGEHQCVIVQTPPVIPQDVAPPAERECSAGCDIPDVVVIVGKTLLETIKLGYVSSPGELVKAVRKHIQAERLARSFRKAELIYDRIIIHTVDPRVVNAVQYLHRKGDINVVAVNVKDQGMIHLDRNGEFIEPWVDQFFETSFYLMLDRRTGQY